MSAQYDYRIYELIAKLGPLSIREYAMLAIVCADQAGLSVQNQRKMAELFEDDSIEHE